MLQLILKKKRLAELHFCCKKSLQILYKREIYFIFHPRISGHYIFFAQSNEYNCLDSAIEFTCPTINVSINVGASHEIGHIVEFIIPSYFQSPLDII